MKLTANTKFKPAIELYEQHEHKFWDTAYRSGDGYRRLLLAVIELTIRDATRPTMSGYRNYRRACELEKERARKFFGADDGDRSDWQWYIDVLGLEGWQVEWIESAAGVRDDPKAKEIYFRVSQRSKRYAGSH